MHTGMPLLWHIPTFLVVIGPCGTMRSTLMVHLSNSGLNIGVLAPRGGRALRIMACGRKCWLISANIYQLCSRIVLLYSLMLLPWPLASVCTSLYTIIPTLILSCTIQYCSYPALSNVNSTPHHPMLSLPCTGRYLISNSHFFWRL